MRPRRRAMAAVELACVLPLLTFLCLATIDFSRVIYALVILQSCARNGALYEFYSAPGVGGSLPSSWTGLQEAVRADAGALSVTSQNPIHVEATSPGSSTNNYVEVTVTWNFPLQSLGAIGNLPAVPSSIALTQSVSMPMPDGESVSTSATITSVSGN